MKDDCQRHGLLEEVANKETRKNGAKAIFEKTAADNLS